MLSSFRRNETRQSTGTLQRLQGMMQDARSCASVLLGNVTLSTWMNKHLISICTWSQKNVHDSKILIAPGGWDAGAENRR